MKKWLFGKTENIKRDSYLWNLIASGINAVEAIIILAIATRTVGLDDSGILAIAFTVSNLLANLARYGVRNYQTTDIESRYTFVEYWTNRLFCLLLMVAVGCTYLLVELFKREYSFHKAIIIGIVVLIYGIDAYEEVYIAGLQKKERLDIGTKMFSLRWIVTLFVWGASLIIFHEVVVATLNALVVDLCIVLLLTHWIKDVVFDDKIIDKIKWKGILKDCFPLCVSCVLGMYLPNSAKYAIDACMNDVDQAVYSFISMPLFVIELLSFVIFQPILVEMAGDWNSRKKSAFVKKIIYICILILIIACIVIGSGYFIGLPLLSGLYGVYLYDYKLEFLLILAGGVSFAYVGWFTSVLTLMREQKIIMFDYAILSVIAVYVSKIIVAKWGILGGSIVTMGLLSLLAVMMGISVIKNCICSKKI